MASLETAILFDLDGVLVDSRGAITSCIGHALDAQGLPRPDAGSLEQFIGPPLTHAFAALTGHAESSELVLTCLASYRARYRDASLRETTVTPGIAPVLTVLSTRYRLAVATSKPLVFAEPLLAALDLRRNFDHISAPALDAHQEDKATTIRRALSTLGTESAVMIGDRSFDVVGAHACGVPAIGVSWGVGTTQELTEAGADAIVETPASLAQTISDLLTDASQPEPQKPGNSEIHLI